MNLDPHLPEQLLTALLSCTSPPPQRHFKAALALNEITDKSVEYLTTYLSQLDLVEKRFPASTVKLGLNFTWSDAFNNTLTTASDDIRFEKACILYTIASLYSHLACRCDTGSENGLKDGVKYMQTAIGYLDLLLASIGGLAITSSALDISVGTVTMFRSIMYAQAQAFVFSKIVIANQSHSIAAKVAVQASRYFEEAVRKGAEMKSYVPGIIVHHLEFQRIRYAACAQYFQAQSLSKTLEEKGEGCGEMIARLTLCEELILQTAEVEKNAKKASGGKQVLASTLGQLATTLLGITREALAAKKKENIVIYSDVIPPAADLAAIQPGNFFSFIVYSFKVSLPITTC
jgi:hypothetical protein